jgi:hypothetical protein
MNLKKIIREEIEDFTWITDAPLNPWLEYDAIIFDKKPKKKKVNNYIQLALNTKNPSNKGSWETRRKEDIESILRYIKNYGEAALMLDGNNNLVYADPSYYDGKTINSIKYSQLVNKNLNESEEDEWDWAKGIKPSLGFDDLRVGDVVKIKNDLDKSIWVVSDIYMSNPIFTGKPSKKVIKLKKPNKNSSTEITKTPINSEDYFIYGEIKESEEDEWDWARNSFINSNEIKVGNKIRIHNESLTIITDSFKDKSTKLNKKTY